MIYYNNNCDCNQFVFSGKLFVPRQAVSAQMATQDRPIMLALNIPTYVNLYGYGYRNVYEPNELVNVKDPRIQFEGSILEAGPLGK